MRSIVQPLLALVIAGVVSLGIGELAVRLLMPQAQLLIEPGGFYSPDPPGRYRLTPGYRGRITNLAEYDNEIRLNSHGLRGPELEPKQSGRTRLLTIGDSFAFGVGVEDTEAFPALVAERLSRGAMPAEGLNAGIPAFGVPDAEMWFRLHGGDLEPDVVVLSIFLGNDLIDASPDREEILVVDGLLVPGEAPRGLKAWLYSNSQLYRAVKSLAETPALRPLRAKLGMGEPWALRVLREEFDVYRRGAEERFAAAIEATDRALEELAGVAREQGVVLVAFLIPSEIQVDEERWQAAVATLGLDPSDYDREIPRRVFAGLLARHGIPSVDPAGAIELSIQEGESLYFRRDRHWTVRGHQVAAKELAGYLSHALSDR